MRVQRAEAAKQFQPYSVQIFFESQSDESVFKGLLNKLEDEVKPAGIYAGIIAQIRSALR
jgi:hypothetical protein